MKFSIILYVGTGSITGFILMMKLIQKNFLIVLKIEKKNKDCEKEPDIYCYDEMPHEYELLSKTVEVVGIANKLRSH